MGQHFDRLCSIVERHWRNPLLRSYIERARLFDFPGRAHEVAQGLAAQGKRLDNYDSVGGVDFLLEHFFLPFPVVAMEDTASCVLVVDSVEGQHGLGQVRHFVECYAADTPAEEFGYVPHPLPAVPPGFDLPRDASMVIVSKITRVTHSETGGTSPLRYEGELGLAMVVSKRKGILLHPQQFLVSAALNGMWNTMAESAMRNAATALEEFMYFNTPDRFVVRQYPKRARKPGTGPALTRSVDREHYILLRPDEIRSRFGLSEEVVHDRKSPTPHARRRHYRTLRSERFKEARGKTVIVPATWVGPESGEYKGRRYEVCLDL